MTLRSFSLTRVPCIKQNIFDLLMSNFYRFISRKICKIQACVHAKT